MIKCSYHRDEGDQLIGVDGDAPERFVFDPAGNILGSDADGGTGAAIGDRLLIRGDAKFEYDGCGNRIREVRGAGGGDQVERLYRYRADNQLAAVEERSRRGRRVTSFAYDALGRRTEKRSTAWGPVAANDAPAPAATTTRTDFVWVGHLLLAESSVAGTEQDPGIAPADPLATVYLHEPVSFRPLAQVRRTGPAALSTLYHYQLDHLGTPQEVTNDVGHVVWQARLKTWGGVAHVLGDEVSQPIRFQGQYHDAETGLHYNRFRYYAPNECCYVQQDPIGLRGGFNLSSYAEHPSSQIDPFGLSGYDASGRPLSSPNYSVWQQVQLPDDQLNSGRSSHFQYGNEQLHNRILEDPDLGRALGPDVVAHVTPGARGAYRTTSPPGYTWHHSAQDPQTMELVPRAQHRAPGPVQSTLHPDGQGGFKKLQDSGCPH